MQDLIAITRTDIGTTTVPTVNGRDLHEFLDVQTQFKDWIVRRIEEYGFEDGKDFSSFLSESTGGRPTKDYALTVDMAKELSMVERTPRGKQARQYFIECERIAQTMRIDGAPVAALDDPKTLIAAIREESNYTVRAMLHKQLQQCCRQRRLRTPPLTEIVSEGDDLAPAHLFWKAVMRITRAGYMINHSDNPARRAYYYPEIRRLSNELGCPLPPKRELYQSLCHDRRLIGERDVYSKLTHRPVRCWVFRRHLDKPHRG